jgi:hypothetical protein
MSGVLSLPFNPTPIYSRCRANDGGAMSGVLSLRTTLLLDLTVAAFVCSFRGVGGSLVTISRWNRSGAVDVGILSHDDSVDVVAIG